jgi:hypothetical protein
MCPLRFSLGILPGCEGFGTCLMIVLTVELPLTTAYGDADSGRG